VNQAYWGTIPFCSRCLRTQRYSHNLPPNIGNDGRYHDEEPFLGNPLETCDWVRYGTLGSRGSIPQTFGAGIPQLGVFCVDVLFLLWRCFFLRVFYMLRVLRRHSRIIFLVFHYLTSVRGEVLEYGAQLDRSAQLGMTGRWNVQVDPLIDRYIKTALSSIGG